MSFVLTKFARLSVSYNNNVPRGYRYISIDDEGGTILLPGYFDALKGTLKINDIINVIAVDENLDARVTAVSPEILTERFFTASFIDSVEQLNLTVTDGKLNTIQDINPVSTPAFHRMVVSTGAQPVPLSPATFEVQSTVGFFLMPRMTTAQRDAVLGVIDGLMFYNTTLNKVQARAASTWVNLH